MNIHESSAAPGISVREVPVPGLPAVRHPIWAGRFPWLVQGITTRRVGDASEVSEDYDLRLFGDQPPPEGVMARWEALLEWTGLSSVVHARQVHGAVVRSHGGPGRGLSIPDARDGHVTDVAGVLLAVSIADCVPVSIVDPVRRRVGLLHAGWRGAAEGILERGLAELTAGGGSGDLLVHFGPAICGRCYEVGPEVFEALGQPRPDAPTPIDVRAILVERAVAAGVAPDHVSVSERCTRCEGDVFFSHRGGDAGRQIAYLGIRE
jgi:polyphenol oxidase